MFILKGFFARITRKIISTTQQNIAANNLCNLIDLKPDATKQRTHSTYSKLHGLKIKSTNFHSVSPKSNCYCKEPECFIR
jgi:hypothetical protein